MALTIPLTDLTNGLVITNADGKPEWSGTGVFDVLMKAVNSNIAVQYDNGRIKDADYAQVYLGSMQTSITAVIQFLLAEGKAGLEAAEVAANAAKQREVLQAQMEKTQLEAAEVAANAAKQREVLQAQKELYKRQKAGFDDNKQQKILDAQLNAWGITFQDTDTVFVPTQLAQSGFTESFTAVRTDYYDVCDDVCGA